MERSMDRIRILDILRGFAILGTLGTNIWIFAYASEMSTLFPEVENWWASVDAFIRTLCGALINGKFLGLLSVMFGVGLEMKYRQSVRKGTTWPGIYIWVSLILMLEGFLHFMLVMEYDILMGYAAAAIIVSFIVRAGDKAIRRTIIWGGSLHILLVLVLAVGMKILMSSDSSESALMPADLAGLYQSGSWFDQIQARLSNILMMRFEVIFTIPMNVVLFLCGIMMMRNGLFADDAEGRRKRGKLMKYGVGIGLPLNFLLFVPGGIFDVPARYLFAPLLAMGYVAIIARLLESKPKFVLWNWLEKTGKMSLSCYVLQNVLCSFIFYGWGLGIGGKLNAIEIIGVWILVSLFQLTFANVWQRMFKLGPMEGARKKAVSLFS
ncbi:DUF418 domain-containing protein [Paenibacillus sp. GSMTC-2017]|uniref:DUF418 domain-containing protein n=1 Tax=Paenibacillus sp. GSMTC-2017 TaxID=2794350 RepID=UPI0018D6BB48|nr:DUF418 domain-containing protein [Paenibacillus sp. GSMTC-2017]MBH5318409.1 DUF418 domain-containing protein [Paenibacillus sp. GSMTC-2017]